MNRREFLKTAAMAAAGLAAASVVGVQAAPAQVEPLTAVAAKFIEHRPLHLVTTLAGKPASYWKLSGFVDPAQPGDLEILCWLTGEDGTEVAVTEMEQMVGDPEEKPDLEWPMFDGHMIYKAKDHEPA